MTSLSNRACHPILQEIRDDSGEWLTDCFTFTQLAHTVGTTTADLMRRLLALNVVERQRDRHQITRWALRKGYGTVEKVPTPSGQKIAAHLVLPKGMVLLVRNLEATNAPPSEAERLREKGLHLSAIAGLLGISKQAVAKRLKAAPRRLQNWPILGTWGELGTNSDNPVNHPASDASTVQ